MVGSCEFCCTHGWLLALVVTLECVLLYLINLRRVWYNLRRLARLMTRLTVVYVNCDTVANIVHGYFWYKDKQYQVPLAHNNQTPSQATTQLLGP